MGFNGLGSNNNEPSESKVNIGANTSGYSGESMESSNMSALDELRNRSKEKKSGVNPINMNRGVRGGAISEDMQAERAHKAEQNKIKAEQAKVKAKENAKKAKETGGDIGQTALAFIPYVLHLFGFLLIVTLLPNRLVKHVEVYYPNGNKYDYEKDKNLSYKMQMLLGFVFLAIWLIMVIFNDVELMYDTYGNGFIILPALGGAMMVRAMLTPLLQKRNAKKYEGDKLKDRELTSDVLHFIISIGMIFVLCRFSLVIVIIAGVAILFNIFNAKEYTKKWNENITDTRNKKREQEQEQMSQTEQVVYDNISTPVSEQSQEVSDTMFCPNCGAKIPKTCKFCSSCGNQI